MIRPVHAILPLIFLLTLDTFWLIAWPTKPGPYEPTSGYFVGVAVLLAATAAGLVSFKSRARLMKEIMKAKTVFLPVAALLCALLGSEVMYRVSGASQWGGGEGPHQPDWKLERYQMNGRGHRGPLIEAKDTAGKLTILGLGDSFLFGQGVSWNETLLQQIETQLSEKIPVPVCTINAALPGLNTRHEANYFTRYGAATFRPRIVLVQFTLNDPEIEGYKLSPLTPWKGEKIFLWRSHVFFRAVHAWNTARRPYRDYILALYREDNPGWARCKQALIDIVTRSRRDGIIPLLVIYPLLDDPSPYRYKECHRRVSDYAKEIGFDTIDVLPLFTTFTNQFESLRVSSKDAHPNGQAHGLAAEAVSQWVVENWKRIARG